MTRETRVGLVVAGSFLSLVGGVLAVKMRQGEVAAEPGTEVAATAFVGPPEPVRSRRL